MTKWHQNKVSLKPIQTLFDVTNMSNISLSTMHCCLWPNWIIKVVSDAKHNHFTFQFSKFGNSNYHQYIRLSLSLHGPTLFKVDIDVMELDAKRRQSFLMQYQRNVELLQKLVKPKFHPHFMSFLFRLTWSFIDIHSSGQSSGSLCVDNCERAKQCCCLKLFQIWKWKWVVFVMKNFICFETTIFYTLKQAQMEVKQGQTCQQFFSSKSLQVILLSSS